MEIQRLETITRPGLFDCEVSPDGAAVAAVYREDDGQRLGLWSTAGCRLLMNLDLPGPYAQPRFDPEGRRLAAAHLARQLTIWSLLDGEEVFTTSFQRPEITAYAFGRRGETIVIAQGDHLGVWSVDEGRPVASLAMPAPVRTLRSSPDGRLLGVGLDVGGAVLVDIEARTTLATLPEITQAVTALGFHPSEPRLMAATAPSFVTDTGRPRRTGHGWAHVWDYRTGEQITRIPCDYQAALLSQGHYLATLTNNSRSLWIWRIVPTTDLVAHIENAVPELLIDERGREIRQATLAATLRGDVFAVAGLARPISAVGVLRLFAFHAEAVPQVGRA